MNQFMKNKKGFTLVELMIVVVIMAILVAVAVPIYSAVTANARAKTCASNRRAIIGQITSMAFQTESTVGEGTITLTTNDDATSYTVDPGDVFADSATFTKMFQDTQMPYCPTPSSVITVEVTKGNDSELYVATYCTEHEPK